MGVEASEAECPGCAMFDRELDGLKSPGEDMGVFAVVRG